METRWQTYLAELIATFVLVLVGPGAVIANQFTSGGLGIVGIALAFGFCVFSLVEMTAHLSGAHFNPAVTIALWLTKRVQTAKAIGYVASQLVGAVIAGYLLKVIFANIPGSATLGATQLAPLVNPGIGVLVEALLTGFIVLGVFATVLDSKGQRHHAGLTIGLIVAFDILVGAALTGASMNPARSFGPALAAGVWANHWVYWVGPIIGASAAAILYDYAFLNHRRPSNS